MKSFLSSLILLILCSGTMLARIEDVYASGECGNGSRWWHVTRTVSGRACEVWGVDCSEVNYYRDLHCQNVSADPTGGIHTHTRTGDNGVTWYMRIIRNQDGGITWIGGKDQHGMFYETDIIHGDSGPGSGLE